MKLIAIDLDGTLLASDGSISRENREAIMATQRRGHRVAISSGRSLHDTREILNQAGLDCSIMTGNGAVVFQNDKRIQYLVIPLNTLKEIMDKMREIGIYYEIYTNEGVYIEKGGGQFLQDEVKKMHPQENDFDLEAANRMIDIQQNQYGITYVSHYQTIDYWPLEVYKLFVLSFDRKKREELQTYLQRRGDVSVTTSGEQKVEIANLKASKGNALAYFAESIGIPMEDTVAMGDNLNDISMFQVAGTGIAMENAEAALKREADYVSNHHNKNGVAFGLKKWVL